MTDKEKTPKIEPTAETGENNTGADLTGKITFKGKPINPHDRIFYNPINGEMIVTGTDPGTGKRYIIDDGGEIDYNIDQLTAEQREHLHQTINAAIKTMTESLDFSAFRDTLQRAFDTLTTGAFRDTLQELRDSLQPIQDLLDEIDDLRPFLKDELDKEEYGGITLAKLMRDCTPGEMLTLRRDPDSFLSKAIEAARIKKAATQQITAHRVEQVEYPVDKINHEVWNQLSTNAGGQLSILFNTFPDDSKIKSIVYYAMDIADLGDDVKITKALTQYDKRVYIAVSSLFNAGNTIMTASQIHTAMGNTGRPAPNQLKKINDALSKMAGSRIMLNNTGDIQKHIKKDPAAVPEVEASKGKYEAIQYDASLLPMERITATVNGQLTDSAIHVFREPPLMTFAKQRKQVTTISPRLLQTPANKTETNLAIEDYLIERISKEKHRGTQKFRVLYNTLYDRARITSKMQRSRAPEKIKDYLNYYQQEKFIKRYTQEADGITIYLDVK